jgi:hypothetical protein
MNGNENGGGDRASRSPTRPIPNFTMVLDQQPFAKSLVKIYGPVVVGYWAVIALAFSQHWPWLALWLDVWAPAVDFLKRFIPVFHEIESMLVAKGLRDRVAVFQHVIAFGWLVNTPIMLVLFATTLRVPRRQWARLAKVTPTSWLIYELIVGTIFFVGSLFWAIFGFGLETFNPLFDLRRDWAIVVLGIMFYAMTMFGLLSLIGLRGLIATEELG